LMNPPAWIYLFEDRRQIFLLLFQLLQYGPDLLAVIL